MGDGGFTNDQDGLYIDNTVFDQEKTNIAVAVNALDFNESAFELEDAACGTDAMSLLKKQWHAVTDTTVHFKDFYSENVDPFVSKVGKSINDVDGSVYDTLNCSGSYVPDNFHNALPPGQQAFVKPSGTFTPIRTVYEPTIKTKLAWANHCNEKEFEQALFGFGLIPIVNIIPDIIEIADDYQKAKQDGHISGGEKAKLVVDGVFTALDVFVVGTLLKGPKAAAKASKAGKLAKVTENTEKAAKASKAGKVVKVAEDTEKVVKAVENAEKAAKTAKEVKAGEATLKTVDGAEDVVKGAEKAAKTAGEHADDAKKIVKKTSETADDVAKKGEKVAKEAEKADGAKKIVKKTSETADDVAKKGEKAVKEGKNAASEAKKTVSKPSSKTLRKNMKSAGVKEPSYKNAAHHIVAGNSKNTDAVEARKLLKKYGIDINSADNGVFLPTDKGVPDAAYHPSLHTKRYYRKVNMLLRNAESREDALDILEMIREQLKNGTF